MQCRLWLWLGLLFIVSTTTVKSAVVSEATEKHQVRYVWIQTSQTDSIDCEWFYNGCASSYAICFAVQRFKSNLSAMGTCGCSEFGESYEAAGNLRNHSRWCSMMFYKFYISTMFRLWDLWKKNDLWAQNLIHIRIPLCWYSEEIGVPFRTFILHARWPGISSILHNIFSGLLVSCWVHRWIQEDFSSDESSDEGTPRKDLPSVTLRGGCTRHRELGHVIRPWWWVVAGPGWFMI